MLPSWPHFPGAGQVGYRQFAGDGTRPGIALWELLERSVDAAGIPVTLGASVTRLIVRDGTVRGAVVGGREVEASGGVILACGGIEYDAERRDAFLPLPLVPVGHPGNTGDTLRFAAQAGASLWHMSAFFGWPAYRHPDHLAAFTLDVHAPSFLNVDADGRRFADETGWEVHDTIRGWIARANSPAELAARVGLDAAVLAATLDDYAAAVTDGRDGAFGRSPQTLAALEPPLYAIEMWPGLATASGGPVGMPAPRFSRPAARRSRVSTPPEPPVRSGHLTEHGGGLTDAMVFGRIAGHEAAGPRRGRRRLVGHALPTILAARPSSNRVACAMGATWFPLSPTRRRED